MKKSSIAMILGLSMMMVFTGCGSKKETKEEKNQPVAGSDTQIEDEATGVTDTPDVIESSSPWKEYKNYTFDYLCYEAIYAGDNAAVSVGYSGEIHYVGDDESWPRSENQSLCRFGVESVGTNVFYSSGNGGMITKSTDGGKTFTKMQKFGDDEPNSCHIMSFCDENIGIAASNTRIGLTTDGAASWTEITLPECEDIICCRLASKDEFLYVDKAFNAFLTKDGGATWSTIALNLPDTYEYVPLQKRVDITIDGNDSYTVYCMDKKSGALKSFTTKDNFATYSENVMPDTNVKVYYVHAKDDYISLYTPNTKNLIVYKYEG